MAKIPFDIKFRPQIESGEYKVVTDCGESVEVVKWDCKGKCPILAIIDDGDTHDSCFYEENGISYSGKERIFVITPEPELTEFEKAIESLISEIDGDYAVMISSYDEYIKKFAPIIKEAALKDVPRWKKAPAFPEMTGFYERYGYGHVLLDKGYVIQLADLKKLPKEE